ncbi:MAG: hypothetical protein U1G07_23465 [Verrucomicrobiota bacterium]
MKTRADAEEAIRRRFTSEGFKGELRYDAARVIENDRWWYFPCGWIGSQGCIVNKDTLYVNWLGSSVCLEHCLWGHDHGLFVDLVDFSFAPETNLDIARRLVSRFWHMRPDSNGRQPREPVPYRDSEVDSALSSQFPHFRRHLVWYAIPEIRRAFETSGLRFTSALSEQQ